MAKAKNSTKQSKQKQAKTVKRSSGSNSSKSITTTSVGGLNRVESLAEVRNILLPGLPFHWNVAWNSTMLLAYVPKIRKPYEASLIALLLLVVLLIAILAVCFVRYCETKARSPQGYSPPPQPPPDEEYEDHNDVIAEVVNRREQSPYIKNKDKGPSSVSDSRHPSMPSVSIVNDLTAEQWKEEKLKFFRACWKNEMKRRQSLCHIPYSGSFVDPDLYNEAFRAAKLKAGKLTKSAPNLNYFAAMGHKPAPSFNYSTDYLSESPVWSDHRFQVFTGTDSSDPFSASVSSSYEDLQVTNKQFQDEARHVTQEMERPHHNPSNTSVWSTVASESIIEEEDKQSDIIDFDDDTSQNERQEEPDQHQDGSQNDNHEDEEDEPGDRLHVAQETVQAVHVPDSVAHHKPQSNPPPHPHVSHGPEITIPRRTESYIIPSSFPKNSNQAQTSPNTGVSSRLHKPPDPSRGKKVQAKMSVAAELELNLQVLARKGSISLQLESDQIPSEVFLEEEHLKEDTSPGTSGTSISRVFERGDGKTFQTLFQKDQTLGGIMKEFEPLMTSAGFKKHGNVNQTRRP